MPTTPPHSISPVRLDRDAAAPLHRQIYDSLRNDILTGVLSPGRRLAASRVLAEHLGVSRNTILEAVAQLTAEGYLTSAVGSGTFVAKDLPEDLLELGGSSLAPTAGSGAGDTSGYGRESPRLSRRGEALRGWAPGPEVRRGMPFQLGRPALDLFPWQTWSRLVARCSRDLDREALDYSDAAGLPRLREILATNLRNRRGLDCTADQVLIVRGSQQGLDLAARVLLDAGDPVWMEDPGYPAARAAFAAGGGVEIPVPVDRHGLDVEAGCARESKPRLVYVTPSHQYPLGVTMSLPRRLELLRWAREVDAWIIEDDYDSEYRFSGHPLASLAGLDGGRHVIYMGTLSKVVFPALRLGYLVVPPAAVDAFRGARHACDRNTGILEQEVLVAFFQEGHFDRHVRRMRRVYAERQDVLHRALAHHLGDEIELQTTPAGLHDLGWLRRHQNDAEIADQAAEVGVHAGALSRYCAEARLPPALLFGYGGFPPETLTAAVERLAGVFRRLR